MSLLSKSKLKKVVSPSGGRAGDLDMYRWVVITLRNSGASEAQFPLPVTINTERIAFDRDMPTVAPAYYLDTIANTILPRYEAITHPDQGGGKVRNEDTHVFAGLQYSADVDEIPEEYQTVETIESFLELVHSEDCPPSYAGMRDMVMGQTSFNAFNYAHSDKIKAKNKPKARSGSGNSK